jgi:hypothetical protein
MESGILTIKLLPFGVSQENFFAVKIVDAIFMS